MTNDKFNRMHDLWLQSGNPDDDPDGPCCDICSEPMEYEEDFDFDEDTGKVYRSGGGWNCTNKNCGETEKEEQEENE